MAMLRAYWSYLRQRVDEHGIHSPFVFDFYNTVVKSASKIDDTPVRRLRSKLRHDDRELIFTDLGAGSRLNSRNNRTVSHLVKHAAMDADFGKLLAALIRRYEIKRVLELGTSLGIGTSYLAMSPSVKQVITIEGAPEIAAVASENFKSLNFKHVSLLVGDFDSQLPHALAACPSPELVYLDGNHRYEPTLSYFNLLVDRLPENGFIVLDDINWSPEMQSVWQVIKSDPRVQVSLDFFRMGIVCKRAGQAKQDFVLKY